MVAVDPDRTLASAYAAMRDLLGDIDAEFDQQLPEDFLDSPDTMPLMGRQFRPGHGVRLSVELFRRIAQTLSQVEKAHTPATIASELKVIVGACKILVPDEVHRHVLSTAEGALLMLGEEK